MRSAVVGIARRTGLEPQLRFAQAMLGSPRQRRNRLDDLALLRHIRALPPTANCVDVGANRGGVLHWLVASAPAGQHVAFEPLPDLAENLRRRFPAVTVHEIALSDSTGKATFYRAQSDTRSSLRDIELGQPLTVRTARLDDLLPDQYAPSFIKIDVEGAEGLVFSGAVRTLQRFKPTVAFEHGEAAERFGWSHRDVYDLLVECGLRIFDMRGRGPYTPAQFEEADVWNFIAQPG